ncbi:MAG: AbrB family transcriptional regulator [Desulfovermiculus sp.]|nr:AbrB family transcriptional regulator [Desulfovermiculus sp.]
MSGTKDFLFNSDEVYVSRDETTGDVVLSNRPDAGAWKDFFDLIHSIPDSDKFMADRPMNVLAQEHGIFDDDSSQEDFAS